MSTKLLQLQVPEELRERIRNLAKQNRRSMSAEAITILESELDRIERERANIEAGNTQIDPARLREKA